MARTPENRCVPLGEWPEADREAWLRALDGTDVFNPAVGQALRWSPETRKMIVSGYGRWVGWLLINGELHSQELPAARATRDRVEAYFAALQHEGLADYTIAGRLLQLGDALKVMAPEDDFSWIRLAAWRLHSCARPSRDLRTRLRPADEVLQLGLDLMQAADHDRFRQPVERACLFRDGLIIAFLTLRPIRSKNLTGLALGVHVARRGHGWWVTVEEAEGKTKRGVEFPWPSRLSSALERYLDVHRPTLLNCSRRQAQAGEALWISTHGTAMTSHALGFQVKARTGDEFGEPINLHSFRHIAATTIATDDPDNATSIAAILGHASTGSSDRHYNRARSVDAGRRYQAVVEETRKSYASDNNPLGDHLGRNLRLSGCRSATD